jgi:hypothetical protein
MSRGLSQQQRRILGLAYAFNAQLHGGAYKPHNVAPAGDKYREGYKHLLISESTKPPDFFPWMLEHFVGGVPFKAEKYRASACCARFDAFYDRTREYLCRKASLRRAASALHDGGFLAWHSWKRVGDSPGWRTWFPGGYVLSPTGLALAKENDLADIADAVRTVATVIYTTRDHSMWAVRTENAFWYHFQSYANKFGHDLCVNPSPIGDGVTHTVSVNRGETHPGVGTKVTLNNGADAKCYQGCIDVPSVTHSESVTPSLMSDGVTLNADGSIEGECA